MLSSSQLNPADSNTSGRKYLGIFSQLHSRLKETAPMVFTVRLTPNKKKKAPPGQQGSQAALTPVAVVFCSGGTTILLRRIPSLSKQNCEKIKLPFAGARGTVFPGWNLSRGSPPCATQRRAHLGVDTDWSRGAALSLCCLRVLSEKRWSQTIPTAGKTTGERVICPYIQANKTDLSALDYSGWDYERRNSSFNIAWIAGMKSFFPIHAAITTQNTWIDFDIVNKNHIHIRCFILKSGSVISFQLNPNTQMTL